jgi:cytochrome c oxidase subunit 2
MVAAGSFDPQGPVADEIAGVSWLLLILGSAVYLVFAVALAFALFHRRGPQPEAAQHPRTSRLDRRWIIGAGVVMPVVVLAVVYGATLGATGDTFRKPPPNALVVEVVGHQWFWEVRYPGTGVTTRDEFHIPLGRMVDVRLTSADVIHSFWVPELAGKMDALPERTNVLVLKAEYPGEYATVCAEFCGLRHAEMTLEVVAEPPDQFDAWLSGEASA